MNNNQATMNKMTALRLHGMVKAFSNLLETGKNMKLTTDEVVSYLIDSEWDEKHNRRLERLIRSARFRYDASIEDLDFSLDRNLDQNLILRLSDCSWVSQGQDILITGPTGVGKSFIGTALGYQGCQYGHSVAYFSATRLFNELTEAKDDGSYLRLLNKIMKSKLIVLDDFGLEPMSQIARMALLEILEERHRCKSTIIVSQMPVSKWHEIIGEPTIADAIMDRLAYNSYRIELAGDSVRRKLYGLD
jgi:DNA replication protein DnaC